MTLQSLSQRLREMLRRAWREPLVVFMALGLGLYALFGQVSDYSDDPASRRIVVDRQALLTYMQARASDYGTRPEARLDAMSPAEVAALAQTYAREEAMYREALALGLDKGDYLVRQRLVQSLRFLFRNLGETGEPSPAQLQSFYDANRSRYAAPASITFTHVFFAEDRHGASQAEALAAATQVALKSGRLSLSGDAPWPGDRFAYHLNYADRDEAFVASHFGKDMAQRLFAAKADLQSWQGPFQSDSGFHLIRIERLKPGRVVPIDQVREEVVRDYREMQGLRLERSAIDGLVRDFDVAVSPELQGMMKAGPERQ